MISFKKTLLLFSFSFLISAGESNAYKIVLINGTNEKMAIDVLGSAVVGDFMMQEKIKLIFEPKKKIWSYRYDAQKKRGYYENAGAVWWRHLRAVSKKLTGKKIASPVLSPGSSVQLNFNDIDRSICFNLAKFRVALESNGYKWVNYVSDSIGSHTDNEFMKAANDILSLKEKIQYIDNPSSQPAAVQAQLKSVRDVDVNASKIASNPLDSSPRISSNTAAGLNTCTDIHVFIVKKYNKDGKSTGLRLLTRESSQVSMDK